MSYCLASLRFTGKNPTGDELKRLNNACSAVDYDFPTFNEGGFNCAYWRKPLVTLDQIMWLLTDVGFPCEGWEKSFYEGDDDNQDHPYWAYGPHTFVDEYRRNLFKSVFELSKEIVNGS